MPEHRERYRLEFEAMPRYDALGREDPPVKRLAILLKFAGRTLGLRNVGQAQVMQEVWFQDGEGI